MAVFDNIMLYVSIVAVAVAIVLIIIITIRKKKHGSKSQSKNGRNVKNNTKKNSKNPNKQPLPKTIKESIPYLHTYGKGIIEIDNETFSKAYKISDINFKIAPDEEQTSVFIKYGRFLNSFPTDTRFQIVIENKTADVATVFNNIKFVPRNDNLNVYRREMNDILIDKMKDGRNNITQDKFLVVTVKADDIDQAEKKFDSIDKTIDKRFRDISREHPAIPVSLVERLKIMHDIYNQDANRSFYNSKDKNGNPVFDINTLMQSGLTTKDVIGPAGMDFSKSSYFAFGDTYGKVLYLESFPNWLSSEFLADISDILCNMLIGIHYQPIEQAKAMKTIHNMMLNIDGQIAKHQKDAAQGGYSIDLIPPALAKQQKYTRDLIDDMVARDQKMFFVTLAVTVFGSSKEEVEENAKMVTNTANNYLCSFKPLFFQQENGVNTCMPLGKNMLKTSKMLTTESASIFIPYTTQELHQKDGLYYGLNDTSNNMILFNRLLGENYNGLILGESGNGKSFAAKQEMLSVLLRDPNSVVYVIDPEAEYAPLAKALGGEVVDLSPNSMAYINPMDMDIGYGDESDPIGMKTEFIISMIEIMVGNGRVMTPEEKSIISRCAQAIYRPYLDAIDKANAAGMNITSDKKAAPTLNTLYNTIKIQPESSAASIAAVLEMYATGALATFAHRTNIDIDKRFVVYDIKNLGTGTKDLGIHICLNDIWNQMISNEKKGIYTWVYIDEFYLLLQTESSARFVSSIWKRARKRNGVPTGILQNTGQLMGSEDARDILNNTSFVQMFSARRIDRTNLKTLLSISEAQLAYITEAGPGKGLLYANKTIIPFNNQFPTDTNLYKIMSTSETKDKRYRQQKLSFKN